MSVTTGAAGGAVAGAATAGAAMFALKEQIETELRAALGVLIEEASRSTSRERPVTGTCSPTCWR